MDYAIYVINNSLYILTFCLFRRCFISNICKNIKKNKPLFLRLKWMNTVGEINSFSQWRNTVRTDTNNTNIVYLHRTGYSFLSQQKNCFKPCWSLGKTKTYPWGKNQFCIQAIIQFPSIPTNTGENSCSRSTRSHFHQLFAIV